MLSFSDKTAASLELIRSVVPRYAKPVVLSSFGKDSMVMLDIVRRADFKLPILFFREAFFPKKYAFANWVVQQHEYEVHDYPPLETRFAKRGGTVEIVNLHRCVGTKGPLYVPTGIKPPKFGEPFLCGLFDIYEKPTGTFFFPWDLLLIGHKASDVDPILGAVPPKTAHVARGPGEASLLFPLRDFTDADVWEYHRRFDLPVNTGRYNAADGFREFDDDTYNPDYFRACTACMDPDRPSEVHCPKTGETIGNISSKLRVLDGPAVLAIPACYGEQE